MRVVQTAVLSFHLDEDVSIRTGRRRESMLASRFWLGIVGNLATAVLCALLLFASGALGQSAPVSPDQPWHASDERTIEAEAKHLRDSTFNVDPSKTYSLAELV